MPCFSKKECGFKNTIGFKTYTSCDWYYKENCKFYQNSKSIKSSINQNKKQNARKPK